MVRVLLGQVANIRKTGWIGIERPIRYDTIRKPGDVAEHGLSGGPFCDVLQDGGPGKYRSDFSSSGSVYSG